MNFPNSSRALINSKEARVFVCWNECAKLGNVVRSIFFLCQAYHWPFSCLQLPTEHTAKRWSGNMTWQVLCNVSVARLWFPLLRLSQVTSMTVAPSKTAWMEGREGRSLREQVSGFKWYHSLPPPRMSWLPGFITLWSGKMGFEPLWVRLGWGSCGRLERVV